MPIDPHVRRFLDRLAAMNPPSALSLTVGERRTALQHLLGFAGRAEEVDQCEPRAMAGPGGELALRVYTPAGASTQLLPGMVYFHGGGFVAGSLESHDSICRALANACGCRLIAIDYRLAPEHPFPAAIDDGCAATTHIVHDAAAFGIDSRQLVVAGDSAGATLAAVVCQNLAPATRARVIGQLLLCPIMDFGAETESRQAFGEGYFVDRATLNHDLKYYLPAGVDPADPRVSPLRAVDVSGLPPACVHTAEFDPLRDEGAAYAARLRDAGVRTIYHCHSGMIHLFYGMGALIPYAASAYRAIGADVRALLG